MQDINNEEQEIRTEKLNSRSERVDFIPFHSSVVMGEILCISFLVDLRFFCRSECTDTLT